MVKLQSFLWTSNEIEKREEEKTQKIGKESENEEGFIVDDL